MHFNIYIDDKIGLQLNKLAKDSGTTRNALIREALKEWVDHQIKPKWSDTILSFKGIKDIPSFESHRSELKEPKDDPFT